MIDVKVGDMFKSNKSVLVNTINCVGVMGKGLAAIFKKEYPDMFSEYKKLCASGKVHPGEIYPYYENGVVKVINFPTKNHWRANSEMSYIISGLDCFIQNYEKLGIESIAFPALGCGNGGLTWDVVGPLMYQKLKKLPIDIEIYAPPLTDSKKLTVEFLSENRVGFNENYLLVLKIIECLHKSHQTLFIGKTVFQKIFYVLSRYGTDLGIEFNKGHYGPYSNEINNIEEKLFLEGLIKEVSRGNATEILVTDKFKINKDNFSEKDKYNVNETYKLFRRINSTKEAEMVTTVLYSFDYLKGEYDFVTENMIFDYICDWKPDSVKSENSIRNIIKKLNVLNLIDVDYSKDYKNGEDLF